MEALVVRGGATEGDPVSVSDLRSSLAALPEDAWIWVDVVDPDFEDEPAGQVVFACRRRP